MNKEFQKMSKQEFLEEIERIQKKRDFTTKIMVITLLVTIVVNIVWLIILLNF